LIGKFHGVKAATRRNHPAISAAAFFGKPVDQVSAGQRFEFGFADGLALLEGHIGRDGIGALAEQVRRLAHDLAAVEGRHLAPRLVTLLRGFERAVEVGFLGVSNRADLLVVGRIDDRQRASGSSSAPLAVDIKQGIGVHDMEPVAG